MKILANTFQKRTMSRSRSMRCPNVPTGVRHLSVIHAEDDPHSTEPIPRVQAERQAQLGYATPPKDEVVVEDATKKEIKDYLSSHTFKCACARDPEALSESPMRLPIRASSFRSRSPSAMRTTSA